MCMNLICSCHPQTCCQIALSISWVPMENRFLGGSKGGQKWRRSSKQEYQKYCITCMLRPFCRTMNSSKSMNDREVLRP